ncbi:putative pyruvyl transferase EpsI [Rubripirellula obstinata]|uniref:Putative pyruvyl transferase EpsI n=1 Tax=Rubripirellula obstinata TaxID=406547 RepID=A0A5B1CGZ4_9BACT|nr:polysaccharide pyruvyl transferase family protein [Rubripirellula obstinata]KAA1258793.1 putative pyruvyl transferase EpsI [Rubripirellula obstinata]
MRRIITLAQWILPKRLYEGLRFHFGRVFRFSATRKKICSYAGQKHILYALTPTPKLANIGDHAQVVAIDAWLKKHFPSYAILEVDKNEVLHCMPEIIDSTGPDDLVFLHSGGNLGDRGMYSESGRRKIIQGLPNSFVFSLPQTIHFSDSLTGNRERETSKRIYATHPNLVVLGRDKRSGELAKELFPKAESFSVPDFVLSLPCKEIAIKQNRAPRTLICLREDPESVLSDKDREQLVQSIAGEKEVFDTTFAEPIRREERSLKLEKTLDYFASFDSVVTDRYHGLIFSVLCQRPTVVLGTVDHKLTSAFDWFDAIQGLRFADSIDKVPFLLDEVKQEGFGNAPNWNGEYFDVLANRLKQIAETNG